MKKTYKKIAKGIQTLGEIIDPKDTVMPIGFDGAILYHLLTHYYEISGIDYTDELANTVQISSRFDESDTRKFQEVLSSTQTDTVYGLDMRTKTGSLGKMLNQMVNEFKIENNPDFLYTVVFNPDKHADIGVYEEELKDEDRPLWLPTINDLENFFWQENGNWKYKISHEDIENLYHVKEIKELI